MFPVFDDRDEQSFSGIRDPRHAFLGETPADVSNATVGVLGCGSLGGFASLALAGTGVGRLHIADNDHLSEDNIRRHVCSLADVGLKKTDSVRTSLTCRFPQLEVRTHHFCFLENPDRLRELIKACDITLVAVDCEGPKYVINDMIWHLGRPVVFAGIYGGGWAGELILVDPKAGTPCYGCVANALGRVGIDIHPRQKLPAYALASSEPALLTDSSVDDTANGHRSLNQWLQATLTSIMPIASLAVQLATAWLNARRGNSKPLSELRQENASVWRLAIRHVPAWGLAPWTLQPVPVFGNTACPLRCSLPRQRAA